jgi:LmbE family N-acetylglucosaminyl deacetylase
MSSLRRIQSFFIYAALLLTPFISPALLIAFVHPFFPRFICAMKICLCGYLLFLAVLAAASIPAKRCPLDRKPVFRVLVGANILLYLCAAMVFALLLLTSQIGTDPGFSLKTPFFSGKNVMVITPHQDDEINLTGGIIEQYVENGSQVTLVFSTNGDYWDLADTRSHEALAVAASIGLDAEDIVYLGYGDQWQPQTQNGVTVSHIYNCTDGDRIWTSFIGYQKTYNTSAFPCYEECSYTRSNMLNGLVRLILEKRPDVIYCVDHDSHIDHKALDLLFEEAMGIILAEHPDYKPTVYKGFCYGTAWYAEADFRGARNLYSTRHPISKTWEETGTCYQWADRIRLPISGDNLSRMLCNNSVYKTLQCYSSQGAYGFAESVLNGDKVFWERRTDSLLYRADFWDGSREVFLWNDFKLKDSFDISKCAAPSDGNHMSDCITVQLDAPVTMDSVWLYDAPSAEDNILGGIISFDNGFTVEFGPLEPGGFPTRITFPELTSSRFEIRITDAEGLNPGLAEIEAYYDAQAETAPVQFLMPVDPEDNFAYDYWVGEDGYSDFTLYSFPNAAQLDWNSIRINSEGDDGCRWEITDGSTLRVYCPDGQSTRITLSYLDEVTTTFVVSNPTQAKEWLMTKLQTFQIHFCYIIDDAESFFAKKTAATRND